MASGAKVQIKVTVTRNVIRSERVNADGDVMECRCYKLSESQEVVAYMDGKEIDRAYMGQINERARSAKFPELVAAINAKVGLTQERLDLCKAAIADATAEAESDPEVVEYRKAQAEGRKQAEEYERHHKAVEDMMTLNGTTY